MTDDNMTPDVKEDDTSTPEAAPATSEQAMDEEKKEGESTPEATPATDTPTEEDPDKSM